MRRLGDHVPAIVLLDAAAVLIPSLVPERVTAFGLEWRPERVHWQWHTDDGETASQTLSDPEAVAVWDRFIRNLCVLPETPMTQVSLGTIAEVSWMTVVWTPPLSSHWRTRQEVRAAIQRIVHPETV